MRIISYYRIFLYFFTFSILIFTGCKSDTEDTISPVHSNTLEIKDLVAPELPGDFSFSIKADWTSSEGTRLASFTVTKKTDPNCTYSEDNITVSRATPFPVSRNMHFAFCFLSNLDYTLKVHVEGLNDVSQDFHWNNTTNMGPTLVAKAREMLTGCPSFYEPPSWFNNETYNILNSSGCIAWTGHWRTNNGHNETKESYICRLNIAKTNSPTNWAQYLCISTTNCGTVFANTSGFPFPYPNDQQYGYFSESCQGGFVCYAFVYAAAIKAGYQMSHGEPESADNFALYSSVFVGQEKVGDVVLFDFNRDLNFNDHAAIITSVNSQDPANDQVISAFGFDEIFQFGVKETKLWDFHSTSASPPGIFTPTPTGKWNTQNDLWNTTYNIRIYRLQ